MEDEDRSDDETTEDAASVAQANALQESFKSMAEIASCSYEARQVSFSVLLHHIVIISASCVRQQVESLNLFFRLV